MKKYIILLLLISSTLSFAQENEKEIEIIEVKEDSPEVPFAVIERVPVYKGCDEAFENKDLKKCMSDAISAHVSETFNTDITKDLGIPDGLARINVIFKINKEGKVVNVQARAKHPKLEEEAIRVINLIPEFDKPGYQKGKPVIVPYSLPIAFNIVNVDPKKVDLPKFPSKQQRKLDKMKKSRN